MSIEQETLIRGVRVLFTPLSIDHIYRHFEWNNDPELNRFDSEIPFEEESFGSFKARFERMVYQPTPDEQDFEIHTREGTLIGVAYVAEISTYNRHCRVGLTIGDRDYWGKGYGLDAMQALLKYCFEELDMHRVCAETFEYNDAWRRLVVGLGFRREGVERDYLYRDDRYWDREIFSMLEDEYRHRDELPLPEPEKETEPAPVW